MCLVNVYSESLTILIASKDSDISGFDLKVSVVEQILTKKIHSLSKGTI